MEKLTRIWSERQEKKIAVRIYYDCTEQDGGCRLFRLRRVELLD